MGSGAKRIWIAAAVAIALALVAGADNLIPESWPEWASLAIGVAVIVGGVALPVASEHLNREAMKRSAAALPTGVRCAPVRKIHDPHLGLGVNTPRTPYDDRVPFLPSYIEREIDPKLRETLSDSHFVIIAGPVRTGKTRAAFEALKQPRWRRHFLVAPDPADKEQLNAAVDFVIAHRKSVLWLDDVTKLIDSEGWTKPLRNERIFRGSRRIVATVAKTRDPRTQSWSFPSPPEREGWNAIRYVHLLPGADTSPRDQNAAERLALSDRRLDDALRQWRADNVDIAEHLSRSASDYDGHWKGFTHHYPKAAALVQAACDLRRLGMNEALPRTLVERASFLYLDGSCANGAEAGFRSAWDEAFDPKRFHGSGADGERPGPLAPVLGAPERCRPDEHLVDALQRDQGLRIGERSWGEVVRALAFLPEADSVLLSNAVQEAFVRRNWALARELAPRRVERAIDEVRSTDEVFSMRVELAVTSLYEGRRPEEAREAIDEILACMEEEAEVPPWSTVSALTYRGILDMVGADIGAARQAFQRALAILEAEVAGPEADPMLAHLRQVEIGALLAQIQAEDSAELRRLFALSEDGYRKLHRELPAQHPYVLFAQACVGMVAYLVGDDRAEPFLSEATEQLAQRLEPHHEFSVQARMMLCTMWLASGNPAPAEVYAEQLLGDLERAPDQGWNGRLLAIQVSCLLGLAQASNPFKREKQPVTTLQKAVAQAQDLGAEFTVVPRGYLAAIYLARKRYEEACNTLHPVHEAGMLGELVSLLHTDLSSELILFYLKTLLTRGRAERVEPDLRHVVERCREDLPTDHPALLEAVYLVGTCMAERGEHIEAEHWFAQALAVDDTGQRTALSDTSDELGTWGQAASRRLASGMSSANAAMARNIAGDGPTASKRRRSVLQRRQSRKPVVPCVFADFRTDWSFTDELWPPGSPENLGHLEKAAVQRLTEGRPEVAERLIRSVTVVRDRTGNEGDAPYERSTLMARALEDQGKQTEARRWRERAIREQERLLGATDEATLEARGALADADGAIDRVRAVDQRLRVVLERPTNPLCDPHPPNPNAISDIEEEYRVLHREFTESLGARHECTQQAAHGIGTALALQGRFSDAHEYYCAAMRIDPHSLHPADGTRRWRPPMWWARRIGSSPFWGISWLAERIALRSLAVRPDRWFLLPSGKAKKAPASDLEVSEQVGIWGFEHRWGMVELASCGENALAGGDTWNAARYLREAATALERECGPDHVYTVTTLGKLGFALQDKGCLAECVHVFLTVAERVERVHGRGCGPRLAAQYQAALSAWADADFARAARLCEAGEEGAAEAGSPETPVRSALRVLRAAAQLEAGMPRDAEETASRALTALPSAPQAGDALPALGTLAAALHGCAIGKQGREDEARPVLERAVAALASQEKLNEAGTCDLFLYVYSQLRARDAIDPIVHRVDDDAIAARKAGEPMVGLCGFEFQLSGTDLETVRHCPICADTFERLPGEAAAPPRSRGTCEQK
ncbi:hypothetical protein FHX37_3968 [Haloactinospora alba]|uniref:Tetratricopeptide repeat protein n=1 Tax=Haloactinospora alba TaxID=405555 RepID=A0A543N9X4_9ACTN|nr:hypothetical protein [Haloactinospora alba]TQN28613.1 hypothetical protein FHX37_3968 [Haloactinospora alba]